MAQSQFSLLKTQRFLPLFVVQFLGAFNDNIFKNALIILLTYQAGEGLGVDPRLLVTAAAGIFILPFFLFSALAGQLSDKFEKARLVRIIKFAEIPLMALAAPGFMLGNYWLLLAVLFCVGVRAAFFGPLKYGILPVHLRNDELIGGNALVEAGTFLAILLGTILGGILVLQEGGVFMVSAIILFISACGWCASLRIPAAPSGSPGLKINYNFSGETWSLLRHARGERDVFFSIIGISWFWLVGFTFLAQFPVYASAELGANEQVVTLFLTVFSIGIVLGSLICNRLLKGRVSGAYVPLGAFGMTVAIFLLWVVSPQEMPSGDILGISGFLMQGRAWAILLCLLLVSVSGGIYIVPLYAIMQARCAPAFRSRTVAVNNVLNALFMVTGALATMVMLKCDMSVADIFLTVGIVNIPMALLVRKTVLGRSKFFI